MSKIHEDRALWLYCYNGGSRSKLDCARQAVAEFGAPRIPAGVASIFDITQEDYKEDYIDAIAYSIDKILKGEHNK